MSKKVIAITDLRVDDSLDPRSEKRKKSRIEAYADNLVNLPEIVVDEENRILDGIHRYHAHKLNGSEEVSVTVVSTKDDVDALTFAIKANAKHGLGLSLKEIKQSAIRLWQAGASEDHIADTIGRSRASVTNYLQVPKRKLREEQRKRIVMLYVDGFSQVEIANILSQDSPITLTQATVSVALKEHASLIAGNMHELGKTNEEISAWLRKQFPKLDVSNNVDDLLSLYNERENKKAAKQEKPTKPNAAEVESEPPTNEDEAVEEAPVADDPPKTSNAVMPRTPIAEKPPKINPGKLSAMPSANMGEDYMEEDFQDEPVPHDLSDYDVEEPDESELERIAEEEASKVVHISELSDFVELLENGFYDVEAVAVNTDGNFYAYIGDNPRQFIHAEGANWEKIGIMMPYNR